MIANYFFIDGSTLTAQIRQLRRKDRSYANRLLDPQLFIAHFRDELGDLGSNEYKRATFYFPKGDEVATQLYLKMPDHKRPGLVRDLHFKFCGVKLKGTAAFTKFVEEKVPRKYQNRVNRSEKGIDIEICCDALKLASASRLERLFILTNDDDFAPLCRALKEFGANVSLIHLSDVIAPNQSLLSETDSYDVIPEKALQAMFFPPFEEASRTLPIESSAPELAKDEDAPELVMEDEQEEVEEEESDEGGKEQKQPAVVSPDATPPKRDLDT
jgi:uncharacterized LabA/DUF88 family protein